MKKQNYRRKCLTASLTVEAALVFAIVFFSLGMVDLFFPVLKLQLATYQTMYKVATKSQSICALAGDKYSLASEGYLVATCYRQWKDKSDTGVLFYAKEEGNVVVLKAFYEVDFFTGLLPKKKLRLSSQVRVPLWTGYERKKNCDVYVYITKNGRVYHKSLDCYHLKIQIREIATSKVSSYRNEDGAKYYPCEFCGKKKKGQDTVYITSDGTRYHYNRECLALMRYIQKVPLSEVVDSYPPCKTCGGE